MFSRMHWIILLRDNCKGFISLPQIHHIEHNLQITCGKTDIERSLTVLLQNNVALVLVNYTMFKRDCAFLHQEMTSPSEHRVRKHFERAEVP